MLLFALLVGCSQVVSLAPRPLIADDGKAYPVGFLAMNARGVVESVGHWTELRLVVATEVEPIAAAVKVTWLTPGPELTVPQLFALAQGTVAQHGLALEAVNDGQPRLVLRAGTVPLDSGLQIIDRPTVEGARQRVVSAVPAEAVFVRHTATGSFTASWSTEPEPEPEPDAPTPEPANAIE
ncbi:MAG: hypothetical protein ACI8PZ_000048 [Myxococcota bacterium]|jgi:hypothetical protein